jgi:hypothetical protein
MLAYKFDTRISGNGTISIPFEPVLFNTEVEIIILPKSKVKEEPEYSGEDFREIQMIKAWKHAEYSLLTTSLNKHKNK